MVPLLLRLTLLCAAIQASGGKRIVPLSPGKQVPPRILASVASSSHLAPGVARSPAGHSLQARGTRNTETSAAWSVRRDSAVAPLRATSNKQDNVMDLLLKNVNSAIGGFLGKKTVVITGTSSGLGLQAARSLLENTPDKVNLIMAVRDTERMEAIAEDMNFPKDSYQVEELDLASFDSVRAFADRISKSTTSIDALVCNAAVYLPATPNPTFTVDGFEMSLQVNHLSHFLLVQLLMDKVKTSRDPRVIIVGSVTGNTNTVGGGAVLPFADLGDFEGLRKGGKKPISMITGETFNGAKAYKDSKLCNMMTVLELHRRYHSSTGISFTSLYPGCIADTNLFREKRGWFRFLFPLFMKYVTGAYVSESEAGDRLAQVVMDEKAKKSGVYWSWNGGAKTVGYYDPRAGEVVGAGGAGGELFENEPSDEVQDTAKGKVMYELSMKAVGLG